MQAGVTCTSFLLTTQLESGNWRKKTRPDARTRALHSNTNFWPHEPPIAEIAQILQAQALSGHSTAARL